MGILGWVRDRRARRLAARLPGWRGDEPRGHLVQVYPGSFVADDVAAFLREGLEAGEVAVAIARPRHLEAIRARLPDASRCFFLDAEETLAGFMADGRPDRLRFLDTVGDVVQQAAEAGDGRVRAFGEMVVVLCERGQPEAAQRLEELWNELVARVGLKLLCAYPLDAVASRSVADRVLAPHSHALPVPQRAAA